MSGFASARRVLGPWLAGLLLMAPSVRADELVAGGPGAQNQPSLAVNPLNPLNLVVAFQDWSGGDSACAVTASTDAGRTWGPRVVLPGAGFGVGVNPRVVFNSQGKGFVACQRLNRDTLANRIDVTPLTSDPLVLEAALAIVNGTGANDFNDKPFLAVDDNALPELIVAIWEFRSALERALRSARSTDGGQTWSSPVTRGGFPGTPFGPFAAVLPNGTLFVPVLDAFGSCQPGAPFASSCAFSATRSTNGGQTFDSPLPVFGIVNIPSPLPGFGFRTNSFPRLAVDPTNSDLYLAWNDSRNGASEAFISRSTNGGASWGPQTRVTTNPPGTQSFFPAPAVGPGSALFMSYYRTGQALVAAFAARSTDQGLTWTEEQISDVFSNPNTGEFPGNNFIGDYIGTGGSETSRFWVWGDFRGGTQDIRIASRPANPNALAVGLGINAPTLSPAQTLKLSAQVVNPPSAPVITGAHVLAGLAHPDGNTLTFFTDLSGGQATGTLSNPASWVPIATDVTIPPGTDLVFPGALEVPLTAANPPGVYVPFLAVREGEILRALSFKRFNFVP